jgi:hypothetical protein
MWNFNLMLLLRAPFYYLLSLTLMFSFAFLSMWSILRRAVLMSIIFFYNFALFFPVCFWSLTFLLIMAHIFPFLYLIIFIWISYIVTFLFLLKSGFCCKLLTSVYFFCPAGELVVNHFDSFETWHLFLTSICSKSH